MSSDSIYRFYVYAYLRSSDTPTGKAGTPYYIGKGTGKRAWAKHGSLQLPPNKNNIVILESKLSNVGACAIERRLITWFGKKIDNSGILHNITDGGDGASGPKSDETKEKLRQANLGKKQSEELVNKRINACKRHRAINGARKQTAETKEKLRQANLGKKQSEETICKKIAANTGKKRSKEHCDALSKRQKGIPQERIECPHCGKIGGKRVMYRHHFDRCKLNPIHQT